MESGTQANQRWALSYVLVCAIWIAIVVLALAMFWIGREIRDLQQRIEDLRPKVIYYHHREADDAE